MKQSRIDLSRLTQQQAAELAGVTSRALRDWTDAPRNLDGTYSGPAIVQWLVARASGDDELADQRQRLAAAQAEKVETENRVRRKELMEASAAVDRWGGEVTAVRARLLAMPSKLGPTLINVAEPAIISQRIRAEVYAALAELAGMGGAGRTDSDADSADVGAAAGSESERVGGSVPPAVQRKQRRARPVAN